MKVKIIISCLAMLISFNGSFGSSVDDNSRQKIDLDVYVVKLKFTT